MNFKTSIFLFLLLAFGHANAEVVKLSFSKICHDQTSPSYNRTKRFTGFDSLLACINAGGRLPKNTRSDSVSESSSNKYNRKLFYHWADEDNDCLNTRHEVLQKLSTSTASFKNSCNINGGRWLDPYTGKTFYLARDLDIDHLVPLKWAWEHGANKWSPDKRKTFANDERNLFAVQASVNRIKAALGVLKWLPPNVEFHCQYVSRFVRVIKLYGLKLTQSEAAAVNQLLVLKCEKP